MLKQPPPDEYPAQSNERAVLSQVLGNVTHELKTPLHSILALAQLLESEMDGPLTAEQKKQISMLIRNAHSLLEMINLMLTFSSLDIGALKVSEEAFSASELLRELEETLILTNESRADSSEREIHLSLGSMQGAMLSDAKLIRQLLLTVVSSIIDLSPKKFRLELLAEITSESRLEVAFVDADCKLGASAMKSLVDVFGEGVSAQSQRFNLATLRAAFCHRALELLRGRMKLGEGCSNSEEILSIVLPTRSEQNEADR